jgi:hypothetical protein
VYSLAWSMARRNSLVLASCRGVLPTCSKRNTGATSDERGLEIHIEMASGQFVMYTCATVCFHRHRRKGIGTLFLTSKLAPASTNITINCSSVSLDCLEDAAKTSSLRNSIERSK